jgi:hypothetical protein
VVGEESVVKGVSTFEFFDRGEELHKLSEPTRLGGEPFTSESNPQ